MASVVTAPGKPGEPHTGLIHSILARTEERLAATLDARAAELSDELRLLRSMLDRLVQLYLVHTPEVGRPLRGDAIASANRRYASFRHAVSELAAISNVDGSPGSERRGASAAAHRAASSEPARGSATARPGDGAASGTGQR